MTSRPSGHPLLLLTVVGAAGFWIANLLISLTPVAAAYRAATHISYVPMLLEALVGGLMLAAMTSAVLLRLQHRRPDRPPIRTALLLSLVALLAVTIFIELPGKLGGRLDHPWHELAVATAINVARITALGLALGYFSPRLMSAVPAVTNGGSPPRAMAGPADRTQQKRA